MASDNPNYHSELPLLWSLFWAKHAQNYENECSEESEEDNHLEKKYFLLTLRRMQSQLQVFFFLPILSRNHVT